MSDKPPEASRYYVENDDGSKRSIGSDVPQPPAEGGGEPTWPVEPPVKLDDVTVRVVDDLASTDSAAKPAEYLARLLAVTKAIAQQQPPCDEYSTPGPWPTEHVLAQKLAALLKTGSGIASKMAGMKWLCDFLAKLAVQASDQEFWLYENDIAQINRARAELINADSRLAGPSKPADSGIIDSTQTQADPERAGALDAQRVIVDLLRQFGLRSRIPGQYSADPIIVTVDGSDGNDKEITLRDSPRSMARWLADRERFPIRGVPVTHLREMVQIALKDTGTKISRAEYDEAIDAMRRAGQIVEEKGYWKDLDGRSQSGPVLILAEDAGTRVESHSEHPRVSQSKPKLKRRKRAPREVPTPRQLEAYGLKLKGLSLREVGEQLRISKSAAGKLVKLATETLEGRSRSVRPKSRLPQDRRGQTTIGNDSDE